MSQPPRDHDDASPATGRGWAREAPRFVAVGEPWSAFQDVTKLTPLMRVLPSELGAWADRLHRGGVIADRRNSPSLSDQLDQAIRRPIDTVICGALDVDPNAALNSALLARFPLETLAGVILIGRITGARRVVIVTDISLPSSWTPSLKRMAADFGIRVEALVNDYPQPDPTLMVYSILGRRLRPGRLPSETGAILFDAAAAVAVGRYALLDERMLQSPLVLRDHALERSHYLTVPVGSTLLDAFDELKLPWRGRVFRAGDLLRDVQVLPDAVIGGGELIYHIALPSAPANPEPCIRCGWCVDSCPTRVHPASVLEAAQRADVTMAVNAGLEACIECGVCSYVCPSNLPLLQGIQKIKLLQARESYATGAEKP